MRFEGLHTAIITPFDPSGHLDEKGLRKNIQYQVAEGVDGIVALGTTGETPTLSPSEKEAVIKIAREETKGKVRLTIGTGSYATEQAIQSTQRAEKLGADFALVVTPYYNKPTQEGLYRHFKAISEATSLPLILYNIQGRTGQNIHTPTLKRLAELPNIVGVKEASGNIHQMTEVIETIAQQDHKFCVLSGDDNFTFPLMALGGHGTVSVISNLVPKQVKALVEAAKKGDLPQAREKHYELLPLMRGAFIETNPIPIKAAMRMCGMAAGGCRLPLCEASEESQKVIQNILKEMNLIKSSYGP